MGPGVCADDGSCGGYGAGFTGSVVCETVSSYLHRVIIRALNESRLTRRTMENRFGIKDLFLFLLIAALLGIVALAMVQYDRQYEKITSLQRDLGELKGSLARMEGQMARGMVAVMPQNGNTGNNADHIGPTTRGMQDPAAV